MSTESLESQASQEPTVDDMMTTTATEDANSNCRFRVAGFDFGLETEIVQEVLKTQQITSVPKAPQSVRGLINLRGQIVPAVDVRQILGFEPCDPKTAMNVVVFTDSGSVSLLVDEIEDVLMVNTESFELAPGTLQGTARELTRGAYKLQDRLLLLLDVGKTLEVAC